MNAIQPIRGQDSLYKLYKELYLYDMVITTELVREIWMCSYHPLSRISMFCALSQNINTFLKIKTQASYNKLSKELKNSIKI